MSDRIPKRVIRALGSAAWAMRPEMLQVLIDVAHREGEGVEALSTRLGRPLDNARDVQVRDGVAIIPVMGPLFTRADMLDQVSGATSYEALARDLQAALDDPSVGAILLDVDSPGGQVHGVAELAQQIRAAAEVKPVEAYVGGVGASAAYWLASAAQQVTVSPTSELGSIGVAAAYHVPSSEGPRGRTYQFVSSQSPHKRPDPATEAGRGKLQTLVDRLASEFVGAVAANRRVTVEAVLERFGQGGVEVGTDAVALGMADAVGSFESVLSRLAGAARRPASGRAMGVRSAMGAVGMTDKSKPAAMEITADTIRSERPDVHAAIRAEGYEAGKAAGRAEGAEDGAKAERARILGVEQQALPGHEALIAQLKADGKTSPAEAAVQVLQAEKGRARSQLDARREADGKLPDLPVRASDGGGQPLAGLPFEERCKREFEADPKLQAEFRSVERYTAWRRLEGAGRSAH